MRAALLLLIPSLAAADTFGGFSGGAGRTGVTAIENLTIESASYGAISVSGRAGRLAVTDVDVQGVSAHGIRVYQEAAATVTRPRRSSAPRTAGTSPPRSSPSSTKGSPSSNAEVQRARSIDSSSEDRSSQRSST